MRENESCCLESMMLCGCCSQCDQDENPDCHCDSDNSYCFCDPDEDELPPCAECGSHDYLAGVAGLVICRMCNSCNAVLHLVGAFN